MCACGGFTVLYIIIIQVMDQIEENGICIYPLPDCDSDEDESYKESCDELKVSL